MVKNLKIDLKRILFFFLKKINLFIIIYLLLIYLFKSGNEQSCCVPTQIQDFPRPDHISQLVGGANHAAALYGFNYQTSFEI